MTSTTTTAPVPGSLGGDRDAELGRAVDDALGAALSVPHVFEVGAVEGGLVEVVRRGRRERLPTLAQGALFALLRERGAEVDVVHARLPGGIRLVAGPLADGRVAIAVHKPVAAEARLGALVEEGLLPPGIGDELVGAVLEGRGVVVVGPSRSGRARVCAALAHAVAGVVRCTALTDDVPAGCLPAPGVPHLVARARTAVALGADVVIAVELSVRELADLAANTPGAPLLASVVAPSVDVAVATVGEKAFAALAPLVAVVAFASDGQPRLLELHGGASTTDASSPSTPALSTATVFAGSPTTTSAMPPSPTTPTMVAARPRTLPGMPVIGASAVGASAVGASAAGASVIGASAVEAPVALGDAPPADWASADADDDPGWELGSLARDGGGSVAPGSFDATLATVARRPAFAPRAPTAHPAAHALRGTGGLTFEPPSGPGAGNGGDDGGDDDDGSREGGR